MVDKIIVELTDKLYKNEIDIHEFKRALIDNGYSLSAGLTMEAFDVKPAKREGLLTRLINYFK